MVHRCCISSCGMNVRVAEAKGLSYHGFPIKEPLREQWMQAIVPHLDKPEAFRVVPKYTRVCSRHFRKKDYSVDIKKRARLNSNAVPSVFPRKNSPIVITNVLSSPSRASSSSSSTTSINSTTTTTTSSKAKGKKKDDVNIDGVGEALAEISLSTGGETSTSSPTESGLAQIYIGGPSRLEIENLVNHFNSSLLTDYNNAASSSCPIHLSIGLEDLHLPESNHTSEHPDQDNTSTASSSSEDIHNLFLVDNLKTPSSDQLYTRYNHGNTSSSSVFKSPSSNRSKKKAPDNIRLTGVTKKHKKEKIYGQFSVERFSNSDKDIEYYTGFSSYRNFEAFFRSLEAYVERLRVTDVMFGVANLDRLYSDTEGDSSSGGGGVEFSTTTSKYSDCVSEFILPLPPTSDEPIKRRPFHGRSMSRIDELFMTIIRLRRKLPEKVLGHMFCISQPTVSRIIRAWTVLLSKLIDSYPVEGGGDGKSKSGSSSKSSAGSSTKSNEHSYTTSRGLGIPESFRQLFHSELAQSIVVTSVSAKDKKIAQKPYTVSTSISTTPSLSSSATPLTSLLSTTTTINENELSSGTTAKRSKKSRVEECCDVFAAESSMSSSSTNSTSNLPSSSSVLENELKVCDLLDSDSNLLFNNPCLDVGECEIFQQLSFLD